MMENKATHILTKIAVNIGRLLMAITFIFSGFVKGIDPLGTQYKITDYLEALHIDPLAEQMPHQLSGGQRQRVALARALAAQPGALLLDEPFSALDPALRQTLRDELNGLQQRLQLPMVLITHDPEDARQLGDHIIHLQDGRVLREEFAHAPAGAQRTEHRDPVPEEVAHGGMRLAPVAAA